MGIIHSKNYSITKNYSTKYSFKKFENYSFKKIIHFFEKLIIAQGYPPPHPRLRNIWTAPYNIKLSWLQCESTRFWNIMNNWEEFFWAEPLFEPHCKCHRKEMARCNNCKCNTRSRAFLVENMHQPTPSTQTFPGLGTKVNINFDLFRPPTLETSISFSCAVKFVPPCAWNIMNITI